MTANFIGKTIGPYRIDHEIGRGGMGVVYHAHQPSLNRSVAVKVLPHSLASDPEMVSRFQQEARALAGIQHENIVHIHDILEESGTWFLVMEYLDGVQLSELIERGVLDEEQILAVGRSIAHALTVVHARGIVHRDIKSHNVMVTRDGKVKLMDFGVARVEGGVKTVAGSVLGTPDYMAPEQIQGQEITPRTDLYSLGVLLYEMCTGRLPYEADDPFALAMKHVTDEPTPPRELKPGLSKDLEDTILRAMSKDPEQRQESASLLEKELVTIGTMLGHDVTLGEANPRPTDMPPLPPETPSAASNSTPKTTPNKGVRLDFETLTVRARQNWLRLAAAALLMLLFGVGLSMALKGDEGVRIAQETGGAGGSVLPSQPASGGGGSGAPSSDQGPRTPIVLENVLGGNETSDADVTAEEVVAEPVAKPQATPAREKPKVEVEKEPAPEAPAPAAKEARRPAPTQPVFPEPDYRCSEYAEFDVSPEEARVIVDGVDIGEADAWDGSGGGDEWTPGPGRYTVEIACRGYESRTVTLLIDPRADDDECDVDFELERLLSKREIRKLGGC